MADILVSGLTSPLGNPRMIDFQGESASVPFPIILGKQGGTGFQYEGGVITVDATSPNINVSFDRPMIYNGSHSHVPSGKPYDIGTPTLAVDSRSINIPINVGLSFLEPLSVVAPNSKSVVVTWASPAVLLSSEGWIMSTVDGVEILVVSIRAGTAQTFITTTTQTAGATYSLYIPASSIFSYPNGSANDSVTLSFLGGGDEVLTPVYDRGPSYSNPPPYEPPP